MKNMKNLKQNLIVGTRASKLAIAQTNLFIDRLLSIYPDMRRDAIIVQAIKTSGDQNQTDRLDQMGGKGLFAKEIEKEIISGAIDVGVHSMKDMPILDNQDLSIGCWLERNDYRDGLISKSNLSFQELHSKSIVGTSSIRRRSQLINLRKDIAIRALRGNVDTRIGKLNNNEFDAIILSIAGLKRLSLDHMISYVFSDDEILPASCQGAIGIQMLNRNEELKSFLSPVNHFNTEFLCNLERDVLREINANCNSPIGILAKEIDNSVIVSCEILDHEGEKIYENKLKEQKHLAHDLGKKMGQDILSIIGQKKIDKLDKFENDFNYSP
jgi:hydroxymethylbilane synthase